jgi:O-antigen/teichoic acid export membrane protein
MTHKSVSVPSSGRALAASIGKNTAFGSASSVAHLVARLVVVPVIIRHLGLDGYGIWAVLMTIAAYMSLGAAGVKSAFQKYVAEATGTGDYDRASRLLSTGTASVLLLSVVVLVPLAIFSKPLAVAVGVPAAFLPAASEAIVFLALTTLFTNVGQTYQSILMGAHRIDLREKISLAIEPLNAATTIVLLLMGYGLVAMCVVYCVYQLVGSILLYRFARRVLPAVRLSPQLVSRSVARELVWFGGSYQLVSMLEALYAAVLPIAALRFFGADAAGVLALSARLVSVAALIQGPYLQAILSGGSLVYASGSLEQIQSFIVKSFKAMSVITVVPLAFIALYGTQIAWVWTGKSDPLLKVTICLLCAASFCRSLSSLFRVLYRASGGAVMDNAQVILSLAVALVCWPFAARLGFHGIVSGMAVAGQFLGLIVMCASLTHRIKGFDAWVLAPNLVRFFVATAVILGASIVTSYLGLHWKMNTRVFETIRLAITTVIYLLVAGPALILTGSISRSEVRMMLHAVSRRFASPA